MAGQVARDGPDGILRRPLDADGAYHLLILPDKSTPGEAVAALLSPRQREIAELVASGCRNWQIARLLGVSENTVVNHVSAIYDRLGIGSRAELAMRWHGGAASAAGRD